MTGTAQSRPPETQSLELDELELERFLLPDREALPLRRFLRPRSPLELLALLELDDALLELDDRLRLRRPRCPLVPRDRSSSEESPRPLVFRRTPPEDELADRFRFRPGGLEERLRLPRRPLDWLRDRERETLEATRLDSRAAFDDDPSAAFPLGRSLDGAIVGELFEELLRRSAVFGAEVRLGAGVASFVGFWARLLPESG